MSRISKTLREDFEKAGYKTDYLFDWKWYESPGAGVVIALAVAIVLILAVLLLSGCTPTGAVTSAATPEAAPVAATATPAFCNELAEYESGTAYIRVESVDYPVVGYRVEGETFMVVYARPDGLAKAVASEEDKERFAGQFFYALWCAEAGGER